MNELSEKPSPIQKPGTVVKEVHQPNQLSLSAANYFLESFKRTFKRELTLFELNGLTSNAWRELPTETQETVKLIIEERNKVATEEAEARKRLEEEREKAQAHNNANFFLNGYRAAFGRYPTSQELRSGAITNQAWQNLSEYAKATAIEIMTNKEDQR